mgnify:FL=1
MDEHTLFMAYSVAKGVTAMALLSLVDKGLVGYGERVVELWPEFGAGGAGKQDITVGDAVSHRAGLGSLQPFSLDALWSCVRGHYWGSSKEAKEKVQVKENRARAERVKDERVTDSQGSGSGRGTGTDWREAWRAGERFVEAMAPEFEVGVYARYHPLSFSWIMGGILQRVLLRHRRKLMDSSEGKSSDSDGDGERERESESNSGDHNCPHWKSVSDIVKDTVGAACGCETDMFIGLPSLSPEDAPAARLSLLSRVALLEPLRPWCYQYPNPMSELRAPMRAAGENMRMAKSLSRLPTWLQRLLALVSYFFFLVLAVIEGVLCCAIGNCNIWRGICLPSSNGYFTSQAVAVMYGALANGGVVEVAVPPSSSSKGELEGNCVQTKDKDKDKDEDSNVKSASSRSPSRTTRSTTKLAKKEEEEKKKRPQDGEGMKVHLQAQTGAQAGVQQVRVFSQAAVDQVFSEVEDATTHVPMYDCHTDRASWGRHSKGFSPWPLPTLHGSEHMASTLGHQGMGGCSSFGCRATGLAVCVLRNVYDPLVISEGAVKVDDGLLSEIIRDVLKC